MDPNTTAQQPVGYQPPTETAPAFVPPTNAAPQPDSQNTAPFTPAPVTQPIASPPQAAPAPFAPTPPAPPAVQGFNPGAMAPAPIPAAPMQGFVPGGVPAGYHANVETGGFDDDVKTGEYESYSGQQGRSDRIGFLTPRSITWGRTHYIPEKGYFICDSTFEKQAGQEVTKHLAACCQRFGPPKKRFSALICHYATDARGALLPNFSYMLKVWRFNEQVFDNIRTINKQFPLEQCDIMATCTDTTFKKFTILPLRECYVHMPDFRNAPEPGGSGKTNGQVVDAYIAAMKPRLDRTVGTACDAAKWAELMGGAAGMPAGFPPGVAGGFVPGMVPGTPGGASPIDSVAALLRAPAPGQQ